VGMVLLRNGRAFHLGGLAHNTPVDIGIDGDGRVVEPDRYGGREGFDTVIDLKGAWVSPAWVDLHVHCYYGGTWLSLRPRPLHRLRGPGRRGSTAGLLRELRNDPDVLRAALHRDRRRGDRGGPQCRANPERLDRLGRDGCPRAAARAEKASAGGGPVKIRAARERMAARGAELGM